MAAFQQETCNFNHLNHSMNLNYVQTSSPYRAVNTLSLGYKNQSVSVV